MQMNQAINAKDCRMSLLNWYDKHKRTLPWRAQNKQDANPYYTWLSEIMLQQTTVQAVTPYFLKFISIWPTINDLAQAEDEQVMAQWAGLGYYARARNLLKCARVIEKKPYNGLFPDNETQLLELPGIGPYTAAAICSIAFDKPANVVDGNVERVVCRLYKIETPLPQSKPIIKDKASELHFAGNKRAGDFAQSLMDLGATICTPKQPKCPLCPLKKQCLAYAENLQSDLPKKLKKAKIPTRYGHIFWIENNNEEILVEKREDNIMLGGMLGLPCSNWHDKDNQNDTDSNIENIVKKAILKKDICFKTGIHHTFSHFHLKLSMKIYFIDNIKTKQPKYRWVAKKDIESLGFPTLFQKAVSLKQKMK